LSVSHWRQVLPKKLGFPHLVHLFMFLVYRSPLKDFFNPLQKLRNESVTDSLTTIGRILSTTCRGGSTNLGSSTVNIIHGNSTLKSKHAFHPSVLSVFAKFFIADYAYSLFKIIIRDRQLSYRLRQNTRFVSFSSCLQSCFYNKTL
jgi:hypothetical protein